MSDEESKFNEEFDMIKAMREGQASADKFFMNRNAYRLAIFEPLLIALESTVKAIEDAGINYKESMPSSYAVLEQARLYK